MSQHMVIFQTADGSPAYSQFESVSEAVGFVESLRNDQGIENARMFELKEIKYELKPIFKVELKELNPAPSAPASAQPQPQPEDDRQTDQTNGPSVHGISPPRVSGRCAGRRLGSAPGAQDRAERPL